MPNPHIAEAGKATQWTKENPGPGRPKKALVDRMADLIRQDETGEALTVAMWWSDTRNADPTVRRNARNDAMDRLNGKPSQSLNIGIDGEEDMDMGF